MRPMNYMKNNGFIGNDPFTERIIGLAIEVHSELGSGFVESVYHRSLIKELLRAGIPYENEVPLEVLYKGEPVGSFAADIIIEKKLLLELKAVESIATIHEVQVVNYLNATGIDLGLILNFGSSKLQIKRKFRRHDRLSPDIRLHED
jgi:GxxExxY protein